MKHITYNIGNYEGCGADISRLEYARYARAVARELERVFECAVAVIADSTSGSAVTLRGFAPDEEPAVERDCHAITRDVWIDF